MSSQLKWAFRKWITTYVPLKVLSGSQSFLVSFCFQSMYPPWYSTLPQAQSNRWEDPRPKTPNYKPKYFSLFFLGTLSQQWNLANTMKSGYFFSNARVEQFNETILLACPNHSNLPFCWQSLPMFDLADDSEFFYRFGADYWHIYVFLWSEWYISLWVPHRSYFSAILQQTSLNSVKSFAQSHTLYRTYVKSCSS